VSFIAVNKVSLQEINQSIEIELLHVRFSRKFRFFLPISRGRANARFTDFPKSIVMNEENASLEIYASPSPCKLKQFCNLCLKTNSLNHGRRKDFFQRR